MQIIIGADFVPTESNYELFASGDIDTLLGEELKDYLDRAQYRIFNLEVPLTDKKNPIPKCGPNLIAPTRTIKAYKKMNADLLLLANNHIFDQDIQGMISTCKVLGEYSIGYTGAGKNKSEAAKPYFFDFAGKKIGLYACCEHEFGIATENCSGANGFDPLESLDHISGLKDKCDYVIVIYHGGKEHYRYPSPMLQKTCRKIVEKGADIVICQHSHCIGCEEKYNNATIVYGQGNFLFDRRINECWDTSLLVEINEKFEISYKPLTRQGVSVRLAQGETACKIMEEFNERSKKIKQDGFIEKKYNEFSDETIEKYLFAFSGIRKTVLFRAIDKFLGHHMTGWILKKKYTDKKKLMLQNFIECEAHRELFLCGLRNRNDKL